MVCRYQLEKPWRSKMVQTLNVEKQSAYYMSVSKIGSRDRMRNKDVVIPVLSEM